MYVFLMILAMAVVTYLIRMLPMVLFHKKIKSRFIRSVLYYVPYAVLAAMTFPYVLYSSGHILSAAIGTAVALVSAFCRRNLVITAILACLAVLAVELLMLYVF